MRNGVTALAVLLLLAVPASATEAFEANMSVGGPVLLDGNFEGELAVSGALFDWRQNSAPPTASITGSGTWKIVENRERYLETTSSHPLGYDQKPIEPPTQATVEEGSFSTITPSLPLGNHSLRLIIPDGSDHTVSFDGPVRLQPATTPSDDLALRDPEVLMAPDRAAHYPPTSSPMLPPIGNMTLACTCQLVIFDYDVDVDGTTHDTGPAGSETPAGPEASIHEVRNLVFIADGTMTVTILTDTPVPWLYVKAIEGDFNGDVEFRDTSGSGDINGTAIPTEPDVLQTLGNFTLEGDVSNQPATWKIEGESQFVAANTVVISGERPTRSSMAPTAAVAAGAVGILALLWLFLTETGHRLLTAIPGLNKLDEDPIVVVQKSPVRVKALRLLTQQPTATRKQLCEATGASYPTMLHHLVVLERIDVVQRATQAAGTKMPQYQLNTGSLKFPVAGLAKILGDKAPRTVQADQALASMNTPVRKAIFDAIQAAGGEATTKQVHEALQAAGHSMSVQAMEKHLHTMVEGGAVAKERRGNPVFWLTNVDAGALKAKQMQRYIGAINTDGARHVKQHLQILLGSPQGLSFDAIYRSLQKLDVTMPRTQSRRGLDHLVNLGLLTHEDELYRIVEQHRDLLSTALA